MDDLIQNRLRKIFDDDDIIFDKSRFAGGLTNYNYIMNIGGMDYVIRKPGGMTDQMIDRAVEKVNTGIACELGLNSECFYFDEVTGIKISLYIGDSKNIAQADPCKPANIRAVSNIMKKIHGSKTLFPNAFDWKTELAKYENIVISMKGDFFFDYHELKEHLMNFIECHILSLNSVPCHNDTVPENFIVDEKGGSWLIDWEYAGMNDPSWDVAAYILESRLTDEAIDYLFSEYYGKEPDEKELIKIKCFMMVQDLLWTVWSLIRHYNGEDFLEYCSLRYERFRKNIKQCDNGDVPALSHFL